MPRGRRTRLTSPSVMRGYGRCSRVSASTTASNRAFGNGSDALRLTRWTSIPYCVRADSSACRSMSAPTTRFPSRKWRREVPLRHPPPATALTRPRQPPHRSAPPLFRGSYPTPFPLPTTPRGCEAETHPRTRTPAVHDEKRASGPPHAKVLGEHGPEVRDVAKRVSHGREVEVPVAERQRLRHALAEADPSLLVRLGEHPRAGVDAHDGTPRPHDGHGGAGERTGPHGDVEDLHPFREPGAPQCVAAVPCARAERHEIADAIVLRGGVVEETRQETSVPGLVPVVGGEDRVRRHPAWVAIVRVLRHHPCPRGGKIPRKSGSVTDPS